MNVYQFKLYIAGETGSASQALSNLRDLLAASLPDQHELEVIDILTHPQRAEEDSILATPVLIRADPPPIRRVIGDLTDRGRVLAGLELPHPGGEA